MADLQALLERAAASPARPPDVAGPYRKRRRTVWSSLALLVVVTAAGAGVAIAQRSSGPDSRVQVRAPKAGATPKAGSTPKPAPTLYRDRTNRMSISIASGWQRMPRALRPWLFSPHEILSLATTSLSPTPGPGNHAGCASEIAQVVIDRIGPDGGYLSIDEWRSGQGIYTSEPRPAHAADLHWSALCPLPHGLTGQGATFREAGRDFTISLVFGAHGLAERRAELYAMLDSLHFDP